MKLPSGKTPVETIMTVGTAIAKTERHELAGQCS